MKPRKLIVLLIFIFPMSAYADFADVAQLIKEISQLKHQYRLLEDAYQTAQSELSATKRLGQNLQGHYGMGNLFNSNAEFTQREWSPSNWDSALKGLAGHNRARYQQLREQYQSAHPTLTQSQFAKTTSVAQAKDYHNQVTTNQAASINATYAFNNINARLKTVHQLSSEIEKTQNTKAAMDLNARLMSEAAYIQLQQLKMQTLINEQMAQAQASRIAGETQAAQFNDIDRK